MVIPGTFLSKLSFKDFSNIFLKKVTEDELQTKGQIEQSNGLFIDCINKSLKKIGSWFDISTIIHKIFETNPSFHVK